MSAPIAPPTGSARQPGPNPQPGMSPEPGPTPDPSWSIVRERARLADTLVALGATSLTTTPPMNLAWVQPCGT